MSESLTSDAATPHDVNAIEPYHDYSSDYVDDESSLLNVLIKRAKKYVSIIPTNGTLRVAGSLALMFTGYILSLTLFQHKLIYMYPRYSHMPDHYHS